MNVHLYWCADCKIPGCKKRQIFKGVEFTLDTSGDPTIEISSPAKFEMRCKTCGTIHINSSVQGVTLLPDAISAHHSMRYFLIRYSRFPADWALPWVRIGPNAQEVH
jgi:hypothetical protein